MKKILDIFKKKEETDYEVVKSRSGLPIHILPLPDGINFDIEDETEKGEESEMNFTTTSLDKLKGRLSEWLDWIMTLLEEEPEFQIKSEGKILFLKVTEKGGRDIDNTKDYFMVLGSLKDENKMNKEIETE